MRRGVSRSPSGRKQGEGQQLPRLDAEMQRVRKQLKDLEDSEADLRRQLLDPELRSRHNFVSWLAEQIDSITAQKKQRTAELDNLERLRAEALKKTGLENLHDATNQFMDKFDHLTGTERRNFVERILKRIVVRNDNVLDFEVFEDPTSWSVTDTGRIISTDRSVNGGVSAPHYVQVFPPTQVTDSIVFIHTPLYKNKSFLHQKYVLEGLSIAQIAEEIFSSKDAVRGGLQRAGIPIREARKHHGNPSQARFGQKVRKGRAVPHQVEQRVIRTVRELRGQGLTLRAIAKILDEMKVPTKCRGKSWHPEMVSRILSG